MPALFAIYSGSASTRGPLCVARAASRSDALRVARANGLTLTRQAYARPLSLGEYASMLRACGFTVTMPEQTQLTFNS